VLADELGVRIEDLRVVTGNSAAVPHGTGSYASRTAVISSGAGILAAKELRRRMLRVASHLLSAEPEHLEIVDSQIRVKFGHAQLTLPELARALYAQIGRVPPDIREDLCVLRMKLLTTFFVNVAEMQFRYISEFYIVDII
jgi:carbon-monoxide dehydrogenase large subunit